MSDRPNQGVGRDEGQATMDLDTKIPSKGTLRERIAELEELEATGAAIPSTIVDLHEFLDALYTMSLEHARKTLR